MSVIFQPGQELDSTGLTAKFLDNTSSIINDLEVRYSIYYYLSGSWESLPDQYHQTPTSDEEIDGKYWVDWEIPMDQTIGGYQIRWDFRDGSEDMWKQMAMNFEIVKYSTTSPVRTAIVSDLSDTPIVIVR